VRNLNARQPGLNSLLELITDGKVPEQLPGTIQATLDILPFLGLAKREPIYGAAEVINRGGIFTGITPDLVVPAQEAWLVLEWSIELGSPSVAQQRTHVTSVYRGAPFPGHRYSGLPYTSGNTNLASPIIEVAAARQNAPQWLRPGDALDGVILATTGGTISAFGFAEIIRVKL